MIKKFVNDKANYLLIGAVVYSVVMAKAFSIDLLAYKDNAGNFIYQDATIEKLWSSNEPTCLKDGSTLLGVNKAFKSKSLKYADCSNGKVTRKHKALGYKVNVIKLDQLSDKMIQQIYKAKK